MILNKDCIFCNNFFKNNISISCGISYGLLCYLLPTYLRIFFRKQGDGQEIPQIAAQNFLRIIRGNIPRWFSCGSWNPQETVTHKGISWEPESLENSAGNGFPAEIYLKSAGNSVGKSRVCGSARAKLRYLFQQKIYLLVMYWIGLSFF